MMDSVAHIVRLANSPKAPRCRGWDASDPAGYWMHDLPKVPDYCHGFRLFEGYEDALVYAVSLDTPSLLGFDTEVQRWTVEPMAGDYGC